MTESVSKDYLKTESFKKLYIIEKFTPDEIRFLLVTGCQRLVL